LVLRGKGCALSLIIPMTAARYRPAHYGFEWISILQGHLEELTPEYKTTLKMYMTMTQRVLFNKYVAAAGA
jgi:hypothetical protein